MNRTLAAAVLALVVGFGGGLLAAKGFQGGPARHAQGGGLWNLFGKPRAADAPRRGIPKPDGFAVWKTRLDTSGEQPLACIQLTRPLDPAKSYADFVLISPELDHAPAVTVKDDSCASAASASPSGGSPCSRASPTRPATPWPRTPTSISPSATSRPTWASPARA